MEEGPREHFVVVGGADSFIWGIRLIGLLIFVGEGAKVEVKRYRRKTTSLKVSVVSDLRHR